MKNASLLFLFLAAITLSSCGALGELTGTVVRLPVDLARSAAGQSKYQQNEGYTEAPLFEEEAPLTHAR